MTTSGVTAQSFLKDGHAPFNPELRDEMRDLRDKLQGLNQRAETEQRDLNPGEQEQVGRYVKGLSKLIEKGEVEYRQRYEQLVRAAANPDNQERGDGDDDPRDGHLTIKAQLSSGHPLSMTPQALDSIQTAIDARSSVTILAGMEQRAALQSGTYGAPRTWAANALNGPRMLITAAGIPEQSSNLYSQYPKLTLAAVNAGVGETTTLAEFAASTAGSVTGKRYGRFTDFSEETLIGADAGAVTGAHRIAIARDLDSALIGLVNTDAGSAIAFAADVKAAIRKSINTVADNTAGAPGRVVVLSHPDNIALLEDVVSTGGVTIGESFPLFAGALVYASSAVPTGFMLVGNLALGCRFLQARALQTRTEVATKTSVLTVSTDIIGGFATGLVSDYVQKVDVVTP